MSVGAQFNLRRKGDVISVAIQPFSHINREHWYSHDFGDEITAQAMYRLIEESLRQRVQAIRENAYNDGYKAGRGKREKRTYFSGCINNDGEA